ncbi:MULTISPECIES: phosphotransferase [unclassified Spirosoma]|uniref:phosphotransferase n=1 Tax=unclassified Spirosoma TaxID=2621999 RepID=UPI00095D8BEE|nr:MULTISPECIES: phosphotransferase [unclassified Spirosoma]MBN8821856.1 phosphotransferase [Spirosoma sp.]OJW80658.1 MAG: aminoglycoside phosphotransferase [Spirosoma sp. 48-14]
MQTFPVSSSILSPAHLAQFLQKAYSFGTDTTCQLLKAGVNHSYLVVDGVNKAVFRIYSLNWRTQTDILEEIRLLKLVKDAGISVSYPIPDGTGNYIQELNAPEGTRFGVLFSYAEGEKLLTFSEELHYKIGQIMARFHQLTHNLTLDRVTYTPEILLVDSIDKFRPFLPADTPEMQFMLSTQQYLLDQFAAIDQSQTRQGVVHLDIWFDNLNIAQDGTVTLFDFDFCGNGLLCFDIAYYILQIHSTETDVAEFYKKKESFLRGYESITPISDEERRLLPMLGESIYFFYIGVQCERFENWSNTFLNEMYLKRFINLRIKRWFDFNQLSQ